MRIFEAVVLAALLFSATACSDSTLKKAAKAELDISTGCSTAFTVLSTAVTQGVMTPAEAMPYMQLLLQVENADAQAENATASLATLNASSAQSLAANFATIQTAVTNTISTDVPQIKDPKTKAAVLAGLTLINTGITTGLAIFQGVK